MRCKEFKDLMLTDYLDGELSSDRQKEVELHMSSCTYCREFAQAAKEAVGDPLNTLKRAEAPEFLWNKVKSAIEQGKNASTIKLGILDNIYSFIKRPHPAFAITLVAAVFLLAVLMTRLPSPGNRGIDSYITQQVEFLSSLDQESGGEDNGDYANFGTSIEEYLL